MAPVASLICIAFIAWLLWHDSKRRGSLSAASWLPTLMLFVFGSRTPAAWLDAAGFSQPDSVNQLFYVLIVGASLIVLFRRRMKWDRVFATNTALMAFYGYFAISSLWSLTPADSLIRIIRDFTTNIILLLVILSDERPLEVLRAVYFRCTCLAFPWSLLLSRFYTLGKSYSRDGVPSFNGVGEQKNSFGSMVMVFTLLLVWDHLESRPVGAKWPWSGMRWDRLTLALMGVWLLHLCQSKTSLVCLLVGVTLLCTRGWLGSRVVSTAIFLGVLSLPFLLLLTQSLTSVVAPVLESLGRDGTFTGRASLWQSITLDTVNPMIGAGFWTFWGTPKGKAIAQALDPGTPGKTVPSAHDGYMDMYLDGGFIVLAILLLLLIISGRRVINAGALTSFNRLRFAVLVVAVFGNLTESSIARPCALWFTTLLVVVEYPLQQRGASVRKIARARSEPWPWAVSLQDHSITRSDHGSFQRMGFAPSCAPLTN